MPHDIILAIIAFLSGNGTSLMGHWLSRTKQRADASHKEADAAKKLADVAITVSQLNLKLQEEITSLKTVLNTLTDVLDKILPHINGLSPAQMQHLRDANTVAKLSI